MPDSVGSLLMGNRLKHSGFSIYFKENSPPKTVCNIVLDDEKRVKFNEAVRDNYWYQMYLDELPIWGMVGNVSNEELAVYTHKKFSIGYNGDNVISVNLTSSGLSPISGEGLLMTYEINWVPVSIAFQDRFNRYLDFDFFKHNVHWASLINSGVIVLFLVCTVYLVISKTVSRDLSIDEEDHEDLDSFFNEANYANWKKLSQDVMRVPQHFDLLASLLGAGAHLFILVLIMIIGSMLAHSYQLRGGTLTIAILAYGFVAIVGGFFSGSVYRTFQKRIPEAEKHEIQGLLQSKASSFNTDSWKTVLVGTHIVIPGLILLVFPLLNSIALFYHSSAAVPLKSFLTCLAVLVFLATPMSFFGSFIGRKYSEYHGMAVKSHKRPVPTSVFSRAPYGTAALVGALPFFSIFIELAFIFSSVWNYKFYFVYGFMLVIFFILCAITACCSVVYCYFMFSSEEYNWQWPSFILGFSVGLWVYLYSFIYYFDKTQMSGFFQTSFYFGYCLLGCALLGILNGTVSWFAAHRFTKYLYSGVHHE